MDVNYKAIVFTLIPNIGCFGSRIVKKNLKWYANMKHSKLTPPNWVFGPTWITLYTSMGYASYLVYKTGEDKAHLPLLLYTGNLLLNWSWTPIYFGYHRLKLAFYDAALIALTSASTGYLFYGINQTAGLLYIPYIIWSSFATYLTWRAYKDNPKTE